MSGWLVASLGAFLLGCGFLPRRWRWLHVPLLPLGLLLAIVSAAHLVADRFTGQGIDEAVLYHLLVGLEGAGFAEYLGVMGLAGALLLASLGFVWGCWRLLRRPVRRWGRLAVVPAGLLLASAWVVNPGWQALLQVGAQYVQASPAVPLPAGYVHPTMPRLVEGGEAPKNLVLIYAESLERTYFDEAVFPGLLPRLGERQHTGLNFTGIDQLPGMGWTVAGMVGSQCGVPLGRSPGWTSQGSASDFLPLATCLGDLLSDAGYSLHYMGGAESDFAGKGRFYQSHGYTHIEGRKELHPRQADPDYENPWGLYDDALLPMVAARFDELSARDAPFVLTTLTLDTHHPNGHRSASCEPSRYADGNNPMLQAVHCSDRLLDELIAHILGSPHAEDTLVVLMSDHMAMRNSASETLEQHPRRNLFLVLGEEVAPQEVTRAGSQLDIAPTLLPLLGFDIEALGLGRNLLGEAPTFHEKHQGSHDALRALYPRLGGLWAYPDLARGLRVDSTNQQLVIGKRRIDYPVLLQVADDGERVVGILQDEDYLSALDLLPENTGFIWVDACHRNTLMKESPASHCLVASPAGDASAYQWPLEPGARHFDTAQLWHGGERDRLPPLDSLIPQLQHGGRIGEWREQGNLVKWAIANPGMAFVGWRGAEGALRHSPRWWSDGAEVNVAEAEFDLDVDAEGDRAEFRGAWVGIVQVGEEVIEEQLSPGDTPHSIARAARWQAGVGSLDLRAFGGFKVDTPEAFLRHDGETLLNVERGIGLVVLSPGGGVVHAAGYDTHASSQESEALARELLQVPRGHYVLLATADEFTVAATTSLDSALRQLGFSLRLDE
ncbi:MAG: sulfatase-like hydrolase/transferase [Pseudomonadota bacterium]